MVPTEGRLVKEVEEGPVGRDDVLEYMKGSFFDRARGDMPFIDSMDVAGDTPSESCDCCLRACNQISKSLTTLSRSMLTNELLEPSIKDSPSSSDAEFPSDS